MRHVEVEKVGVDISPGCGGVWFDNYELMKFDEAHETSGRDLVLLLEPYYSEVTDREKRLRCPREECGGVVLMRRFFSPARAVEIDECPRCGGIWLDPGELALLREKFPTEKERRQMVNDLVNEMARESGLEDMVAQNKARASAHQTRRLGNMFHWLSPFR